MIIMAENKKFTESLVERHKIILRRTANNCITNNNVMATINNNGRSLEQLKKIVVGSRQKWKGLQKGVRST